jgi:hypothetical protein
MYVYYRFLYLTLKRHNLAVYSIHTSSYTWVSRMYCIGVGGERNTVSVRKAGILHIQLFLCPLLVAFHLVYVYGEQLSVLPLSASQLVNFMPS